MYQLFTLKNGIKVLLMPRAVSKQGIIVIGSRLGSRFETTKNNGIFHLTEHAILEGSANFPDPLEIDRKLDAIAGEINSSADKDIILFYILLPSLYLGNGFEILTDFILHPLLKGTLVEKEKNAILEEINGNNDDLYDQAETIFEKTIFSKHPLALPILGNHESVAKLTVSKVERCWRRIVNPKNLAITVVGNFDQVKIKSKIINTFSPLKSRFSMQPQVFKNIQFKRRITILPKDSEQIIFQIGFPTFGRDSLSYFPLSVLNRILGGKYSSRLFQKIRGEKGLAYDICSDICHYQDAGYIRIIFACSPKNFLENLDIVMNEIRRLKKDKVTPYELRETKTYLKGHAVVKFENVKYTAEFYTSQLLRLEKIIPLKIYKKSIDSVKRADVQEIARKIFVNERLNLALVGNINTEQQKELEKILIL